MIWIPFLIFLIFNLTFAEPSCSQRGRNSRWSTHSVERHRRAFSSRPIGCFWGVGTSACRHYTSRTGSANTAHCAQPLCVLQLNWTTWIDLQCYGFSNFESNGFVVLVPYSLHPHGWSNFMSIRSSRSIKHPDTASSSRSRNTKKDTFHRDLSKLSVMKFKTRGSISFRNIASPVEPIIASTVLLSNCCNTLRFDHYNHNLFQHLPIGTCCNSS